MAVRKKEGRKMGKESRNTLSVRSNFVIIMFVAVY